DDLCPEPVNGGIALFEPAPPFREALHREMGGIALVLGRVDEAIEVSAVEADLADLRLRLFDELEIVVVTVFRPVRDHAREFDTWRARLRLRLRSERQRREERNQSGEKELSATHLWASRSLTGNASKCGRAGRLRQRFLYGTRVPAWEAESRL